VLTAPWHERDTQSLVERLGAPGLRAAARHTRPHAEVRCDLVLWIESRRAVVAGDTLIDFGRGLEIPREWLRKSITREQIVEGLRSLLALPVEVVLPAHGAPTDRAALQRALS
jgi:hypothetical protein